MKSLFFLPRELPTAVLCAVLFIGCAGMPPREVPETLTAPPGTVESLGWEEIGPGMDYAVLEGSTAGVAPGAADPAGGSGFMPRVHFVRIELSTGGIRIVPLDPFVRGAEPGEVFAETGAAVVLNATPFRYSLGLRGLRMQPVGAYLVKGESYSPPNGEWGVLWYSLDTGYRITAGLPKDVEPLWAVGGYLKILEEGKNIGIHGERHARTAVGLTGDTDENGSRMYILVVEGEERDRRGLTSRETAMLMERLGVREALNLDGGDSSLLVVEGEPVYRGRRRELACYVVVFSPDLQGVLVSSPP